ncbi:DNA glycosylase AlkZ-like family protein [Nocardiopsis flavescens]|uniref:DNA glycosylase AlkZ-like family protein n=1 Tax=Nocardiopsis flavescens TaxID=758803 RepID=UPI00373FCF66
MSATEPSVGLRPAGADRRRAHRAPGRTRGPLGRRPRHGRLPGHVAAPAGNRPVLYVDGVVTGAWRQRRSGRRPEVTVEALVPLSGARRARVAEQVARIGGVPRLVFVEVRVGPHA